MKRRLKKPVVYSLYGLGVAFILVGLIMINGADKKGASMKDYNYAYNILSKLTLPTVNQSVTLARPYTDPNISIVKDYYDYKAESDRQENSLIYYEDTYIQSTGVSYSNGDIFNVVAVLEGTVKSVVQSDLLGNTITIEHDGATSVYQSLSEISVAEGEVVEQGTIIGKSGTSNISSELNNHLYFELIVDGVSVNPEEYYDKEL